VWWQTTVPYRTLPGAQISEIIKVTPESPEPVSIYFSLPCTNPGGHLAPPVPVQVCVCATKLYFCQTLETLEPLNNYIVTIRYHAAGQKTLFTQYEYGKVRYSIILR